MDIRQQITDEIIKAMEDGVPPWREGWSSGLLAFNASSGKTYSGINQIILGIQSHADPRYMTYKQAEYMGLQVCKGEKGTRKAARRSAWLSQWPAPSNEDKPAI